MSNSSIWPINRTLSGYTTSGQKGPGSNGNERVLHISQSSKTEDTHWQGSYPSAKMQLMYSTVPADGLKRKGRNVRNDLLSQVAHVRKRWGAGPIKATKKKGTFFHIEDRVNLVLNFYTWIFNMHKLWWWWSCCTKSTESPHSFSQSVPIMHCS